jgi:hypothetical protein
VLSRNTRHVIDEWIVRGGGAGNQLSFDQERRLITEEWAQGHSVPYIQPHLVAAFDLSETVQVADVRRALDALVCRHDALRAVFERTTTAAGHERQDLVRRAHHTGVSIGGLHTKRTERAASIPITQSRVAEAALSPFSEPLYELINAQADEPFDVTRAPLAKALILEGKASQKVLVLIADRLVMDWRSMGILRTELEGRWFEPPAATSQDGAVARWSRRATLRRHSGEAIVYWHRRWRDLALAPLSVDDFPFSRLNAGLGPCPCALRSVDLPVTVTRRLRDASERMDVMLLSAVIGALQHATQQSSVSIWTEFPVRTPQDLSGAIGPFSNLHVVTVEFARCRVIGDIVGQVKRAMALTMEHSGVPLDGVWRAVNDCYLPRITQVSFHHVPFESPATASQPLISTAKPLFDSGRQYALQIRSCDDGHTASVAARYNTCCFEGRAIDSLLADIGAMFLALADLTEASRSRNGVTSSGERDDNIPGEPYKLGSHPDECYLCRHRDERERESMNDVVGIPTVPVVGPRLGRMTQHSE